MSMHVGDFVAPREAERVSAREFARLVARAFSVSYRARGKSAVVVALLGFVFAFLPSLLSVALRVFTDAVQGLYQGSVPLPQALVLLVVLTTLYLAQQGYAAVRSYYTAADAERILRYINEQILRCTCTVKMRYIDGADDFAEKISFAGGQAGLQVAASMQEVTLWLQNLLSFLALSVVLADVSPWIIPVILVTCLPSVVIAYRQETERYRLGREQSREVAFGQLYFQDCTRFQCLQELKFQRIFPYIKERKWLPTISKVLDENDALVRRHTLESSAADLFQGSVYLVILAITAWGIYRDPAVGLGAFTLVVSATSQMQNLTSQMFFGAAQFAAHAPYMRDFFALEDFEREAVGEGAPGESMLGEEAPSFGGEGALAARGGMAGVEGDSAEDAASAGASVELNSASPSSPSSPSSPPDSTFESIPGSSSSPVCPADICFDNVSFSYPESTRRALDDVSVVIREGEHVAIVGRNGSGKSTFINLLCGLYEPQEGCVEIGGRSVGEDVGRARAQISGVFQDFGRYEDSIRFNVSVSDAQREGSDEEMLALLEKVDARGFVEARGGLDAVVGSYSEGGANLSGGQWQRLAIARAAWCDRARIMLLDEPTSALDPVAEANIYRNFSDLVGDRTALLVSHRLGVSSVVDRVLVFDGGRIVEDGSPADLLAAGGLYAELYESQARWYR